MSMIIEAASAWSARAAGVLSAWSAVMIAMPFAGADGRQVAILGEPGRAVRAVVTAGGTIVEVRDGVTLARPRTIPSTSRAVDRRGFVAALYAAGAPLVLEARIAGGCVRPSAG